jgi:UDP-glucose 4-epimerase
MKHIVTGGAGFIGSNLVDKLILDGHEVIVIDDLSLGSKDYINKNAEFHNFDISSLDPTVNLKLYHKAKKIFENVDTIFHLAARTRIQPSIKEPHSFNRTNIGGTLNVLDLARLCNVRRFVFSSSSSVYGNVTEENLPTNENAPKNPLSPYGLQKLVGEQYCKLYSTIHKIDTVCLRYFSVYGERQPTKGDYSLVMGIFANLRLQGKPLTINGDGEQRRDFTYVGDVVSANIKASSSDKVGNGEVLNVGNGDNRSVNDIARMIGGPTINNAPVIEPRETLANNNRTQRLLDWKPTMKLEEWMPEYIKSIGIVDEK